MHVEHSAPAEPGSSEMQGPSRTAHDTPLPDRCGLPFQKSTKTYTENAEVKLGQTLCEISTAVNS